MKKKFTNLLLLFGIIFLGYSQDANINLYPEDTNQEVVFGGDGKLTINDWANGNLNLIAQRLFVDMNLKTFRVPIFAKQAIDSPVYDDVITVIKSIQQVNPNVKLMASLANGDGYGNDYHGAHKFFTQWQGCCPYNIYSLNLTSYASYLDSFMQLMSDNNIYIDYLAPFNEDPANSSDFAKVFNQMNNLGTTQKVGLERWGLLTSVNDIDDAETVLDIAGSHFYDDENIADWDATWGELVDKSSIPVWYTEATRYTTTDGIDKLIAGMNNIFPAINGGVESVIFYQAVKRFVWANGGISGNIKYTGFKNIVNESTGKKVINTSITGENMRITAFTGNGKISLHITNDDSVSKTTNINVFGNYYVSGTVTRTIWTSSQTEVSNSYLLNNNKSWNVTVPANSYIHLEIPIISEVNNIVHITKSNATGFAIDAPGTTTANGTNVYLWNENENSANQRWIEIDRGNGYFSYKKEGTNYCIDGDNDGEDRQNVHLWECDENNYNQHWQKIDVGNGTYKLIKRNAPGFALDGGSGAVNAQNVQLYNSSSTSQNLQWHITPIGTSSTKSLSEVTTHNSVVIYPNPVKSVTTIQGAKNATIHVCDMNGSVLLTKMIFEDKEELNLSSLETGIYYVQVKETESTTVVKIVKK